MKEVSQKEANRFRCYENLAKRRKRGNSRAPAGCRQCEYYRPDFKYRTCMFAECPYQLEENPFRKKPLKQDQFSGGW